MVTYTIRLSAQSCRDWNDNWNRIMWALGDQPERCVDTANTFAHFQLGETFEGEGENPFLGSPRWHELAPMTIMERLILGFDEGPILVRTGELRSAVAVEGEPGHIVERIPRGFDMRLRIGVQHENFERLQEGDVSSNLPPRPMWPVGQPEQEFIRQLEELLARDIDAHVRI